MVERAAISEKAGAQLSHLAAALRAVPGDLALPHLLALITIANEPGLSVNELAERSGIPQQTASRYIAILAGRYQGLSGPTSEPNERAALQPLITQEISQADPRSRALFISKQGRSLLNSIVRQLGQLSEI